MTPPLLWWTPLPIGFGSMHPRGEGREKARRSGDQTWWWLSRMPPPPLRGKGQTPAPKPSPKPSKVAKVAAAQPPHEALDVEALGASVATHVSMTDACQVLVEQAAATGVEAALAKGRSADHKSALAKAEKAQGNTQRALDQALNLAAKRGEEVEAMREALREAQEGRRKAEVEVAQLRVEVVGCSVLGRGAEPPQFWVLLIWLEPGISHVTRVHYDATMCLPCIVCSILPVLHFLRFDLCVL